MMLEIKVIYCNSLYQSVPASCSIIQKASNALEVLKEVLDAVQSQHSEVSCWCISLILKLCKLSYMDIFDSLCEFDFDVIHA